MNDEKKQDQIKESRYDGIQEYDNNLPRWWLGTFFVTIIFGFIYWIHFHVFQTGSSQQNEFSQEYSIFQKNYLKQTEIATKISNDALLALLKEPREKEEGKKIFVTNCVTCHGNEGQGGIGPNLTDSYWIHEGKPERIYHTITEGVPEKGMISWKQVLSPEQIQHVAVYVISLKGTNPPNPKAPQGELEK